jgi:hypothetical protein
VTGGAAEEAELKTSIKPNSKGVFTGSPLGMEGGDGPLEQNVLPPAIGARSWMEGLV